MPLIAGRRARAVASGQPCGKICCVWRELIESSRSDVVLQTAATDEAVRLAERDLGLVLPAELRSFLSETDGLTDAAGCTVLAWPLDRIVVENLRHRDPSWSFAQEGPWQHRLCFADNGAGNDFFIDMTRSQPGVLVWSYVDGHAHVMAQSLDAFWAGWLSGTLTA